MNLDDLLDALTPERYQTLKRGVELGKWDDGRSLTEDERSTALQVLIAWDARYKPEEERVGYLPPKPGSGSESDDDDIIFRSRH
jgi:uncharacterized protein YeaC (DUF1315 family)